MATTNERSRLLEALRALRQEEINSRESYRAPWLAHPNQVRHYFIAYGDYLQWAARLGLVDERFLNSRTQSLASFPIHRDNMGSLMGMVGELTSFVKESLHDHEEELARLTTENSELRKDLEKCQTELDSIKGIPKR